ncbi:DUF4435 domain-containing protein [Janthinobacterium sp. P210005]|uniref:DUF4435 domain-containing protein n=1 Tax=Janthinobacterium sp. P210005 TaxID=3112938 RepID=UPI002E256F5D|nr:DUF4435 domain-containing protein [Janthinobacterium sp. P210005]
MDRIEKMKASVQSYSVKFMEVTRIFSKMPDAYVCIFEGEDSKYYSPRLNCILDQESWRGVNAGGKSKVLEIHNCISEHPIYSGFRYACFIDSDYDHWTDYSGKGKLYKTAGYSIENYYTTDYAVRNIIASEFNISEFGEESGDFNKVIAMYLDLLDIFCYAVSEFNYYAKAHRIMERNGAAKIKLNLSNVKISDLVKIDLDSVVVAYDTENPATIFKDAQGIHFDKEALLEAEVTLPKEKWQTQFRGKQQMEFLRHWLSLLKSDRCSKNPKIFSKSGNVKISLSKENCISELSQYASTPGCLKSFLDNFAAFPPPTVLM